MDNSTSGCRPFYIAAPSYTFVGDAGYLLDASRSGEMDTDARGGPFKGCWKSRTSITSCPLSGMSAKQCTRIVLNERPITDITPKTFRTEHVPFDFQPGPGEVLVQVNWLSLDPAMRVWLRDARGYIPPVRIGEVWWVGHRRESRRRRQTSIR